MKNLLIILTIAFIWGFGFLLMKIAGVCFEPFTIGTGRVIISALTLGIYCYYKKTLWWPNKKDISPILVVTILGFCYPFAMQPLLVNLYGSGLVGMILAFMPLLTLIIGRVILKTKITIRQVIGITGGLFFTFLLFKASLNLNVSVFGFFMILTVPIAYTFSNILIKRDFHHLNPVAFTATCALISGLITLPFAYANFTFHHTEHFLQSTVSIVVLGVLMSGVALALFYHVIQQSGPLLASLTNYIVPIFALFWGWFDGEETTPLQFIGILGIFVMIYITQPMAIKPKDIHK